MEHWYTFYTKPNAEYKVATLLQTQGIDTYLPEMETSRAGQGRMLKPFFPCYLFAKVDFGTVGLPRVQLTPGLRRIVAFDNRPTPMPDEAIDLIRRKLDGISASGDGLAPVYRPGDHVRITAGPLQGLRAIFEGPSTPDERVRVLLTFLGGARRTWVPVTDLEKDTPNIEASGTKRPRRTRGRGRRIKNEQDPASRHAA
jgi:transcriptional antiterminator RfaH